MAAMLRLNPEQVDALQAIKRARDIGVLSDTLAEVFPEVFARLADRAAALVAHGVQRGAAQGLDHAVCVGRYLACWCMLGAEFESRPGFEWARSLLAAPARTQGAKAFQLCRRTREHLAGVSHAAMTPAAFDQAIARIDVVLMPRGVLGALTASAPLQLGEACDIDALDLRWTESAQAQPPQVYRWQAAPDARWSREPGAAPRTPVTVSAQAATAQSLPPRLHMLGRPAGAGGAGGAVDGNRLRLRTRALRCCDPQLHPLVTLNGPQGLKHWRGPLSADVTLPLYAEAPPPPQDDAPQPTIALEGSPQISVLTLAGCGMRENGEPFGEQATQLTVYPAEQHLMAWHRDPGVAAAWPEPPAGAPSAAAVRFRLERDGKPADGSRWQAGLQDLDRQLAEGLGRLATAWERESGVHNARMAAEPSVMSGDAGITWGWAESASGMATAPHHRMAGVIDLVACRLNLRLAGELALNGSLSRLVLHCGGRENLHIVFERKPGDTDLVAALAGAQTRFRHPFALQVESMVQADRPTLLDVAGPVGGALVGSCGLRPRASGPGLQWFCSLVIEAVSATLLVHDPLLGRRSVVRPLLPAMTLLDWSLG
jgi:hypothetical protein